MKDEFKYDDFGNLDTDFYVEQAYEMRREYYAQAVKTAKSRVKNFFASLSFSATQRPATSK
ncbi:RSP_7527 family protein [Marinomonas epiphytica]